MSDLKLGEILTGEQQKDAVHIAIAPLTAKETLYPGQHIGLEKESTTIADSKRKAIGIVDPYLTSRVMPGEQFWIFLYPQTVTGLRHDWTHPAFTEKKPKEEAQKKTEPVKVTEKDLALVWMTEYADSLGMGSDEIMQHANDYLSFGEYLIEGGRFEGESVPEEFWDYYSVITGKVVALGDRGSFFSCSC